MRQIGPLIGVSHSAAHRVIDILGPLRNGLYAELFGQLAAPVNDVITAPFGHGALAAVARQDLADAAVQVVADPGAHRNRTYELTGRPR
jgi:uncharacterized protein YbjT (DUF2867 family)